MKYILKFYDFDDIKCKYFSEFKVKVYCQFDGCLQNPYFMESLLLNLMCGVLVLFYGKYLAMAYR